MGAECPGFGGSWRSGWEPGHGLIERAGDTLPGLPRAVSGLVDAVGGMLSLEIRVPSASAGRGNCGPSSARSDLLPGSHHRREPVARSCVPGGDCK